MNVKKIGFLAKAFCYVTLTTACAQQHKLIDKKATTETKNLYKNLFKLMDKGIMFGHQDDLAYGTTWKYEEGRSDVKDVVGDYPAIFGWDIGHIEYKKANNLDTVPFAKIREYVKKVYDMGGVNTISWHVDNPATLQHAWDNTEATTSILPGGKNNARYTEWLDNVATFLKSLKGSDGKAVPILFRPYHELNGDWFWWGKKSTTVKDYVALWKFTVHYLRDKKNVHNLIYIYNTNTFSDTKEYMERYPGDDYADVVSFDNYQFAKLGSDQSELALSSAKYMAQVKNGLRILDSVATKHNKLPTFAETGFEVIPAKDWWTQTLWDTIKDFKISYVLVWRNNGYTEADKQSHYYAPYTGQVSADNFKDFYKLDRTLFEKDVAKQHLYK
ncbi:mannan endo-1,4-beta-mannosidase [Pedobacter sp. UYP30]|uniref:glycoside hydrolase family 26 protein n=1 Tax=Pedobacter sp. UYP30 TaxID=1756400 RepID=UPI003395AF72